MLQNYLQKWLLERLLLMNKNKKRTPRPNKAPTGIREFEVKQESELLEFLLLTLKDQSRNSVKSLLSNRQVAVDGAPISQFNFKLYPGDIVIISKHGIKKKTRSNLPIIFENDEMIVINKPSGLLSIASDKEKSATAYRMLTDYVQQKDKHNRIFVVHRLDEDTSGVLMVSKSVKLQQALQDNWNELVTKRGYYAIVEGHLEQKSGTIKTYLKKNSQNLMYSSKKAGDGQLAITHYKVLQEIEGYSLLEVHIDSGRKNQIRVHLGEMGHHVIGDDKYGNPSNPIKRLGLHAYELELKHPFTGKVLKFTAPIPKEFKTLFNNL